MRKYYLSIILNIFLANYCWAQDAAINFGLIVNNTASIGTNTGSIDDLEGDLASTNSDVSSLRVHSDEQDTITLNRAEVFASRLTALSIATANSVSSMGSDAKLGLGFGYGAVYGEDAFAIGLVSRSDSKKVGMSINLGINEHLYKTIGVGVFFKLR